MAPIIRGIETEYRIKTAATIAAASGATLWQSVHAYSESFQPGQNFVDDDEMGGSRHNQIDPVPLAPGLPNPQGGMQVPLDRNQLAFWLASLWGAPVTTGAGPSYTHTFASGGSTPRMLHVEIPFKNAWVKMADAQVVSAMSIQLGDIDGYRRADLTMIGRSVRKIAAAVSSSPAAAPARDKIAGAKGVIKINGTDFGNVFGGTLNMSNGAFFERYQDDSEWPSALEVGKPSVTCSPQIRVRDDQSSMLDLFDGLTPFTFELLYQVSATQLLRFYCPWMTAPPVLPAAGQVGPLDIAPQFTAAQKTTTTTAPMITTTLVNATATYA